MAGAYSESQLGQQWDNEDERGLDRDIDEVFDKHEEQLMIHALGQLALDEDKDRRQVTNPSAGSDDDHDGTCEPDAKRRKLECTELCTDVQKIAALETANLCAPFPNFPESLRDALDSDDDDADSSNGDDGSIAVVAVEADGNENDVRVALDFENRNIVDMTAGQI